MPFLLAAGAYLWWRNAVRRDLRILAVCGCILGLFATPILIEAAVDRPNNIDAIRAFMIRTPGPQKTVGESVNYFVSFLAHDPAPQTDLKVPDPPLWKMAFKRAYSRDFLLATGLLMLFAASLVKRSPAKRFVIYSASAVLLISLLFLIWGISITGDLYEFNGFFIFGLQWLVLVVSLGLISESAAVARFPGPQRRLAPRRCRPCSWPAI